MEYWLRHTRARKVKCDELKPVCIRCHSSGRTCDGYGIWGGGGNGYAERDCKKVKTYAPPLPKAYPVIALGFSEHQHLQRLRCRIEQGNVGLLGFDFWTKLVLPATWNELAVMHAVVALSSAHTSGQGHQHNPAKAKDESVTLEHYTRAINHLQPLLSGKDAKSAAVVLVTCLLFALLEYTRAHYRDATMHLANGLNVLKDLHRDCSQSVQDVLIIRPSQKHVIDRAIFQGFATLHVYANLFGDQTSNNALLLQLTETEMPPSMYSSLEEARDSLYKLIQGVLLISKNAETARTKVVPLFDGVRATALALEHLKSWRGAYEATRESLASQYGRKSVYYKLLLSYFYMAIIMCQSMHSTSEMVYEDYSEHFIAIIEHAIELWRHYTLKSASKTASIAIDVGWIPPLYYTAVKCRNSRIRTHAIRLLRSMPHREGAWDSKIAATVADKVRRLEEATFQRELEIALDELPSTLNEIQAGSPLEVNRFQDVHVELQEDNHVVITCTRSFNHNVQTVLRCKFDGKRWHDTALRYN